MATERTPEQDDEPFLVEIDGMIEATEEFIRDDGLRADDNRIADLAALIRVRRLWEEVFNSAHDNYIEIPGESPDPNWMNE